MGADAGPGVMNGSTDCAEYTAGTGETWALQRADGTSTDLVLSSCVPQESSGSAGFTLTFLQPVTTEPDAPLEQGTYLLSRPGVDAAPVFLVPVARTAAGTELQAVFNHIVGGREATS